MKNILCIDDIKTNLFTLSSVLESSAEGKYNVLLAQSAQEGLEILIKERVDLILLDIMMPEIDGFECAKMIKSNKRTKHIPIIILTAKGQEVDQDNAKNSGANAFITKPFSPKALLKKVTELLGE